MLRTDFLQGVTAATVATGVPGVAKPGFAQQLTIGVNVPLTGNLGPYGQDIVRGVQAAIDETNRYTATLSSVWGIRTYDDRNTTAVGQSNVFVAASDPSVVGMIGNLSADVTVACLPNYANASFAIVVPCSTADGITAKNFHNVYRLPTKDSDEGALFARYALGKKSDVKAIAVTIDKDFGFDTASGFVAAAKAGKHDADVLTFPANGDPENDAGVLMQHAPTYIFLSGRPERLGPVAGQLRKQGYKGDFGLGDAFYVPATTQNYSSELNDAIVCTSFPPLDRVPSAVTLLNDFHNEVGTISAFSAFGYAAAQLLIQAAQRGNSTTRFQLLNQMQSGGAYNLLVGQYSFNTNGDPTLPNVYFFRVTADGFKYVAPAVRTGFVV